MQRIAINHVACMSICGLKFARQIDFKQLKNPAE